MEPFYHLPPSSTTRDLPSPHPSLGKVDLHAVTSEWLSLTMDTTPAPSLTATPIPPTPPPLPTDLTPFLKSWEPKSPSPAPSQRGFTLLPQTFSRIPPFKEETLSLGHTPVTLPFSQPPPPPSHPPPHSHFSFTSPLSDSLLRYNSGKGLNITETAHTSHVARPEVLSCTVPEPLKSHTHVPQQHKSTVQATKRSKTPDIELYVKDPYDELLSMILDGSSSTDDDGVLSEAYSPPAMLTDKYQGRFKLKAEESHQPAMKPPAIQPASELAGSIQLEVQFHKPVAMEPLSIMWGGQSKPLNEQPVESQRPPSMKGKEYTELFIEEDDEAREDKEEDVFNERLGPQADVCPSALTRLPHPGLPSTSIPPPQTSLPPPTSSSAISVSGSQQHDTIAPSPSVSPCPPSLPHLTTSPPPPVSPSPLVSPPPLYSSHPSPNLPSSQHSASPPSPLPRPAPSTFRSGSPIPLPALSPQLPSSPPLGTPRSSPTVPHPGHRSPKVKRLVQDALHGGGDPYQALYNYQPRNEDELELKEGDIVDVMEKCDDGWFVGKALTDLDLFLFVSEGTSRRSKLFGTFPGNYVKQL
ncbi:hypothetical protein PAMA_016573 [Pampus argenteus]